MLHSNNWRLDFRSLVRFVLCMVVAVISLQANLLFAFTDSDHDGLSDAEETVHGTNPLDPDTDHDGLLDGEEVHMWLSDPLLKDSDGGGVEDGQEVFVDKTDPTDPTDDLHDLDHDGYPIPGDCDDLDPTIYPDAPELSDGQDNNCDDVLSKADWLIQARDEKSSKLVDLLSGVLPYQHGVKIVEDGWTVGDGLRKAPGLREKNGDK